jgi:ABC-type multidrug transport system fused ATPase/permease subunit
MNFKIVEYRNQLKSKNVIINFLMQYLFLPIFLIVLFFIILPVIFIINLFSKEKNEKIIENNYKVKFENEKIKIERKFIEEKDFPDDLDYGEVYDHYLFEFKSNPELQLFKDRYFELFKKYMDKLSSKSFNIAFNSILFLTILIAVCDGVLKAVTFNSPVLRNSSNSFV